MVSVQIGPMNFTEDQLSEGDLAQLIERYHRDGSQICVRVRVQTAYANVSLHTGGCASGGGGGRNPNAQEAKIIELWQHLGLNAAEFAPGRLISFLKQVT